MAFPSFPASFVWGVATAAYQVEGAAREDGRGESIWDRFSHTPGKVAGGDTGDVACDHYHRWPEDLALLADLGVQSYRFSVSWPRIFPTGGGPLNQRGLDFYRRQVEALHQHGIQPALTLYHWDLPQALQDRGGWLNRDTAHRFAEYADCMFRALGDSVPMWITVNEPYCIAILGHALGIHAPGLQDWSAALLSGHHVLLGHGLAMEAFRSAGLGSARAGICLNFTVQTADTESEEDAVAAHRADGLHNRWFLEAVLRGRYPADMVEFFGPRFDARWLLATDLDHIAAPMDFLAVNYYTRHRVRASRRFPGFEQVPPAAGVPVTDLDWEVYPEGLYQLLTRLHRGWTSLPLYVTENGAACADRPDNAGAVADSERIAYLQAHFDAAQQAMAAGVNLQGYYVWSLLDNFEWHSGYDKRFGLVYVDYATQRRIPKQSFDWYRGVIASRGSGVAAAS